MLFDVGGDSVVDKSSNCSVPGWLGVVGAGEVLTAANVACSLVIYSSVNPIAIYGAAILFVW